MASVNRARLIGGGNGEDQPVGFSSPEGPLSPDQSYRTLGTVDTMTRQKVSDLARIKFVLQSINPQNRMEFRRPPQDVQTICASLHEIVKEETKKECPRLS